MFSAFKCFHPNHSYNLYRHHSVQASILSCLDYVSSLQLDLLASISVLPDPARFSVLKSEWACESVTRTLSFLRSKSSFLIHSGFTWFDHPSHYSFDLTFCIFPPYSLSYHLSCYRKHLTSQACPSLRSFTPASSSVSPRSLHHQLPTFVSSLFIRHLLSYLNFRYEIPSPYPPCTFVFSLAIIAINILYAQATLKCERP